MKINNIKSLNNKIINYVSWEVLNPEKIVVISHGMAEHPERYNDFALYLNKRNISVYGIYHIGHGRFANKLGHMDYGDFSLCIDNINELIEHIKINVPIILIAHSMGSFIGQLYIEKYHNIDGLVLSGSTKSNGMFKIGKHITSLVCKCSKDISKPSKILDKLSSVFFNLKIKNSNTTFDWLSNDEQEVKKYIEDPYCGFVCSKGFYMNLTFGASEMGKTKLLNNIDKRLPILILGGSNDPVSNYGKGLNGLYKQYCKLGCKNVSLKIYPGSRHEILNETNKYSVYEEILLFLNGFKKKESL